MKKRSPHNELDAFIKNPEYYKQLVNSLEAYAVVTVSADGTIKSWDAGAERVLGYTATEVLGKSHEMFFTKEDIQHDVPNRQLKNALIDTKSLNEGWRLKKNGERFWATGFVFPLRNKKGKLMGFTKIIRDRTERQTLEQHRYRLLDIEKAAHAETNRVIAMLAEGVMVFDMGGKIQYTNSSAQKILGLSEEALTKIDPHDIHWQAIREDGTPYTTETHPVLITIATGKPVRNAVMGIERPQDKAMVWILVNSSLLSHSEKQEPYAVVVSFVDITVRKNLEQQKDIFIGTASHELKTPLTSLTLFSELLRAQAKKSGHKQLIDLSGMIHAQTDRLIHLMNDLLDVSRIQSGKLELHYQKFDINKAISDIISFLQQTTTSHTIIFKSTYKEGKVSADKDRIGQVVTNLLTNAIKYSPKADSVIVKVRSTKDRVCVDVQDFGEGIPKHEQTKIFERFFRTEFAKQKNVAGFGLGLNITSEIVKRHKGALSVKSEPGKGSTFSFWIPL
jgi:PAS domain S-box-containing protein